MKKNDAAKKLLVIYNSYECRKIKLATMLKKCTGTVTCGEFMDLHMITLFE